MAKRGPNTANGRAAVTQNAVKHGIRSPAPVLPDLEEPDEWERHRSGVIDSLDPEGHLELVLAERIANLLWRVKRVERYETEMIVVNLNAIKEDLPNLRVRQALIRRQDDIDPITEEDVDDFVRRRLVPDSITIEKIQRYEAHLHRQVIQTLHELEAIQTRRRGGATPLARFDVAGAP